MKLWLFFFFYLYRWGIVVHGMIDGYSRLITSLICATDNRASTVLKGFVQACERYGIPSRYRTDRGWENGKAALFINLVRGVNRGSHIAGRSVHNQRIERLWRDVRKEVLQPLRDTLYELEDSGILDHENPVHVAVVHQVWLPALKHQLEEFREAWNKHSIRTVQGRVKTPEQLWLQGMLENANSGHTATSTVFEDNPPSVERTLVDSLAAHNLTLDDLDLENELAEDRIDLVLPPQVNLPAEAQRVLEQGLTPKESFLAILEHLN